MKMRSTTKLEQLTLLVTLLPKIVKSALFLKKSRQQIEAYQLKQIQKMVRHAYENVPFYHQLYTNAGVHPDDIRTLEDFRKLPVISHEDILANVTTDHFIDRRADKTKMYELRGFGTDGKIVDLFYDQNMFNSFSVNTQRIYSAHFEYQPWHKIAYVWKARYPTDSVMGMYPQIYIPGMKGVAFMKDEINRINPDMLVCYTSYLTKLISRYTPEDFQLNKLKMIIANTDYSTQEDLDKISKFFGCPVIEEYTVEEMGRVSAQSKHKTHHIFEDSVYLETSNGAISESCDSVRGELIGTSLVNEGFPIIRYNLKEEATLFVPSRECESNLLGIRDINRINHKDFVRSDGSVIDAVHLKDTLYHFLKEYIDEIKDYCLIQHADHRFTLEIKPRGDQIPQRIIDAIKQECVSLIGESDAFDIQVRNDLKKYKEHLRHFNIIETNIAEVSDLIENESERLVSA